MTILCAATGCRSKMGILTENGEKISFHRFPKDEHVKKKWISNMGRGEWKPSIYSRLCSLHFEQACYRDGFDRRILHSYAIPTIFPNRTANLEKNPRKPRLTLKCEALTSAGQSEKKSPKEPQRVLKCDNEASTSGGHDENKSPEEPQLVLKRANEASTSSGHDENEKLTKKIRFDNQTPEKCSAVTEIEKLKKQLDHYKMLAARRGRKLKNLQRKHSRVQKKQANLEVILDDLTEKLEAEQMSILKDSMNVDNQVVSRYIMKVKGSSLPKEYPIEIKQFALTLQFLSPRAYDYVRTSFNTVLPHPKTLSRWYRVVNCQPGFTHESLETIKLRCAESQKTLYAALCIDEMAIRKHLQWDGTKCYGYVDFGTAPESSSDVLPLAKEALTFMLTCINEAWKIPVGYFMINGLTGQQKQNLVTQCIRLLNETSIKVIALTFDGAPANAMMATELGCNLNPENLETHFKVEEQEVSILYDPCHNIKLIRNALGEKKVFFDENGHEISWTYLERLHELQNLEGLHAANKLSAAHINYENQKMKVKLATQLLSNSVADALQTCKETGIPEFKFCDATIKFIRIFNDLFDIMNSRNFAAYGLKKPLNSKNIGLVKARLHEIDDYINGLKLSDGTLLIKSRKKTGFLGFKICIKSILYIFDRFVSESKSGFYFLPVYKLSQDHLETFYGAIRSLGGFNNNPSAYAFMTAYKKLLVHAEFKISRNGNCLPLDDIRILHSSKPQYVDTINETSRKAKLLADSNFLTKNTEMDSFDHDYTFNPHLSEFSEMVVVYIAGYVVKKLKTKLICEPCYKALENDTKQNQLLSPVSFSNAHLISVKNRGGLYRASPDVVTICIYSEKMFRNYLNIVGIAEISCPKTLLKMTLKVFNFCGNTNVFGQLIAHSTEQCVSNNHLHLLIKAIIELYFQTRVHHEIKKINASKENIRHKFNKLILFQGQ